MSGDNNLNDLNKLIDNLLKSEDFEFFDLSIEKVNNILRYLQYLVIKIRMEKDLKGIEKNKYNNVIDFSKKLILLENYLYSAWKESKKMRNLLLYIFIL